MSKIAKGEVTVSVDKIVSLEREISSKDQTIGVQQERIQNLESDIRDKKWENTQAQNKEINDLKEKLEKEVRIVEGRSEYINCQCPYCGDHFEHYERSEDGITYKYKGLDDVVDMIRKEENKKMNADLNKLEDSNERLTHELDKLEKKFKRTISEHAENVSEAKSRTRDRYNKLLDESEKRYNKLEEEKTEIIAELKEEIQKIQENKTDKEIEEARKQEIIDLKVAVDEYKQDREDMLAMLPKFLRKRFEKQKEVEKTLEKVTARETLVEKVSNNYPEVKRRRKVWGELKTRIEGIDPFNWIKTVTSRNSRNEYYDMPF